MARYEHLPIYRAAFDLAVHVEKIVRHFSRYHKYTLGTELREGSRRILEIIIDANTRKDRAVLLRDLRRHLEWYKTLVRLCHESGGFSSNTSYFHISEHVVNIAKQNEGWLRQAERSNSEATKPEQSGRVG
jgi:hypothetical protein